MIGTVLGPLMHLGGPVVTRAAMYTGALVSGLTLAAMTAPSEKYLQMSGPLMMGFCAVFAASVATAFLPPTGVYTRCYFTANNELLFQCLSFYNNSIIFFIKSHVVILINNK